MSGRSVRVTVEGATLQMNDCGVVRVRVGADLPGAEAFPLLVLDASWPGVTVETVEQPRTWTDGDVIVGASGSVWGRRGGRWNLAGDSCGSCDLTDAAAEQALRSDEGYTLLRYQAGEQ
jgi:hypothetical protein